MTKTLISLFLVTGLWGLDEARQNDEDIHRSLDGVSERFDIVLDISESSHAPPGGILSAWREASLAQHDKFSNWGLSVFVSGSNALIEAYMDEGLQRSDVIRQHFRVTRTVQDALKLIHADRTQSEQDTNSN